MKRRLLVVQAADWMHSMVHYGQSPSRSLLTKLNHEDIGHIYDYIVVYRRQNVKFIVLEKSMP